MLNAQVVRLFLVSLELFILEMHKAEVYSN